MLETFDEARNKRTIPTSVLIELFGVALETLATMAGAETDQEVEVNLETLEDLKDLALGHPEDDVAAATVATIKILMETGDEDDNDYDDEDDDDDDDEDWEDEDDDDDLPTPNDSDSDERSGNSGGQ